MINSKGFKSIGKPNNKTVIASVFIVLVTLLLVVLFIQRNNTVRDLPDILKKGRILVLADSSSIGFAKEKDSISGFQYDMARSFANYLGVELVISEQNNLKSATDALISGDYDVIAQYMPVTTEYNKKTMFSVPLFTTRQVLIQKINNDTLTKKNLITNQLDLENDTIYIPANSPHKRRLLNLSEEIASPIVIVEIEGKSTEQMVHEVSQGQIKQTICDEQFAAVLKTRYPNIDITLTIGFEQKYAWLLNTSSPKLRDKLNSFLTEFMNSAEYRALRRKYFEPKQTISRHN